MKRILAVLLFALSLSAPVQAYDVEIYVDPRCAGLEGIDLADCRFHLREKAEADMKKLYRRAMAYTARKRHLRESQKLWEKFAQYECSQQGNNSSYVPVDFSFCYVRKMQHREKEIRRMYLYGADE